MKIAKMPEQSNRDVLIDAQIRAIRELNITPKDLLDGALTWHSVKQKVNEIMSPKVSGRPDRLKNWSVRPSKEGWRLLKPSCFDSMLYPSNIDSPKKKLKFLQESLKKGRIDKKTYDEYRSVIKWRGD